MCGIAGFHLPNSENMSDALEAMAQALRHRGPDDEGYLVVECSTGKTNQLGGADCQLELPPIKTYRGKADLYLAHRRLSIIDTSPRGHQPMPSPDGRHWIVFNGEIYNFVELRGELKSHGHRFRTGTDTEVALAAYGTWGIEALHRFNGMWSFALYDVEKKELILCRDRFGVKPLYYFHLNDIFAFASEIKSLASFPQFNLNTDLAQVFDYLLFGWEGEAGKTLFQEIRELEPGSVLRYRLDRRSLKINKYYQLPQNDDCPAYNSVLAQNYSQEISYLLRQAVELRLRSDVPIGSCLSGGLDSSTIVCTIDRLLKKGKLEQVGEKQAVFTAGYHDYSKDETKWAKMVAESVALTWYISYPRARELLTDIEDLVYYQEIPFISTSIYAQYRIMKLAREQGIKVLLDGQGGDELFGGYASFYAMQHREMLTNGKWSALWQEWKSQKEASVSLWATLLNLIMPAIKRLAPSDFMSTMYRSIRPECKYISGDFWRHYRHRTEAITERYHRGLNHMLRDMMTGLSLKNLLRYEDRNSMRFSIESRTPFADDLPLIERLFSIPGIYKIHHGWSKHLLRMAAKDLVPEPIRWRHDKIGFATPESKWLREIGPSLLAYMDHRLSSVIDIGKFIRDWPSIINNQSREGVTTVWRFLNLGIWARVFKLNL
jgi:asparagine synthase (glutamine-hydrolysing)